MTAELTSSPPGSSSPGSPPPPPGPLMFNVNHDYGSPNHQAGNQDNTSQHHNTTPFHYSKFYITQCVYLPALGLMLLSCLLLVYIILRHLRPIIRLYVSVLFYVSTELLLLVVMLGSWYVDIPDTQQSCQYKATVQSVVLVLPAYAVLFISVVRTIFVLRPLDHVYYLKLKYQFLGMLVLTGVCVSVFMLPHLGLCEVLLAESGSGYRYCRYGTGTGGCAVFAGVLVTVGYVLPVVLVFLLYFVIYQFIVRARRDSAKLTNSEVAREVYCTQLSNNLAGNQGGNQAGNQAGNQGGNQGNCIKERQVSKRSTKSVFSASDREGRERNSVPWCIIVIVVLYIVSTLPWIPMEVLTEEVVDLLGSGSRVSLLVDVMYSVLLVCGAGSPLMYLLTSNTLSRLVRAELRAFRDMWSVTTL